MTGEITTERSRPPVRLRARIVVLVSLFSGLMFLLIALGGWLVVLEAEDAILEANLDEAILTATAPHVAMRPNWYGEYATESALRDRLNLDEIPDAVGIHEVFASPSGDRAIWVHDWSSRIRMWFAEDLEQEFRLIIGSVGVPRYRLVDLAGFEFTETRVEAIQGSILLAALVMAGAALFISYLIARWTLQPIVRLAAEVDRRQNTDPSAPLAANYSKDEIGFLARALDESEARATAALERERRFISDCSHELRTPVATMKSALTLVEELDDDPAHRSRVEQRMRRAVDRMERLVLLFLVLAREGRKPSVDGAVSIRQIIKEVTVEQAALHQPRELVCHNEVSPDVSVAASRDVLIVLIRNFVANAWLHAGGAQLRFRWLAGAVLQIDDDGVGFPEGKTAEDSTRIESAGFGIGLTLTQRLCRTQGWGIRRSRSDLGGARVEIDFEPQSPSGTV